MVARGTDAAGRAPSDGAAVVGFAGSAEEPGRSAVRVAPLPEDPLATGTVVAEAGAVEPPGGESAAPAPRREPHER